MNLILFGPPGSGKGTQSKRLMDELSFFQISTGDILRSAIREGSELGRKAQGFMSQGQYVPDDIMLGLIKDVLSLKLDRSIIFDGFPRTLNQAQELDLLLGKFGKPVSKVIFLEVAKDVLLVRLTGRRVCSGCGKVFHISFNPTTKSDGSCDNCSGKLEQRNDDKEDVISTRLSVYEKSTAPLKEYYSQKDLVVAIDGAQPEKVVFGEIKKVLNS